MTMIPEIEGFRGSLPFTLADKIPSVTMVTTGHLEIIDGKLYLIEHTANQKYDCINIGIARSSWNKTDGNVSMPKAWIRTKDKIIRGDILLISFVNGDFKTPIIHGSLDMLATRHFEKDLRYNMETGSDLAKEIRIIDNDKVRMVTKHDGAGEIEISIDYKATGNKRKIVVSDKDGHKGIEITTDHINITDGKESLSKLLNDLIAAVQNITVNTPSGTSTPKLINDMEFEGIKDRAAQFLEIK